MKFIGLFLVVLFAVQHITTKESRIEVTIERRVLANAKEVINEINSIGHMFHYRIAKFMKSVGEATKTMKLRANQFFEDAVKKQNDPQIQNLIKDAHAKYNVFIETTKHSLDDIPREVAGNLITYRSIINETVVQASRDIFLYGFDLKKRLISAFANNTQRALTCTWQFAKQGQRFVRKYSYRIRHCANIQSNKITNVIDSSFSLLHNVKSYERNVLENFQRCFKAGKNKKMASNQSLLADCIQFISNNLEKGKEIIKEKVMYIEAKSEKDIIKSSEEFLACTEHIRKEDKESFEALKKEIDTCLASNNTVTTSVTPLSLATTPTTTTTPAPKTTKLQKLHQ